jgi:hypothetical protein
VSSMVVGDVADRKERMPSGKTSRYASEMHAEGGIAESSCQRQAYGVNVKFRLQSLSSRCPHRLYFLIFPGVGLKGVPQTHICL